MTLNYNVELDNDELKILIEALEILERAQKATEEIETARVEMCSAHSSFEIQGIYEELFNFVAVSDRGKRELKYKGWMD